jgi:signal peptidase II
MANYMAQYPALEKAGRMQLNVKYVRFGAVAALVVLLDQISKALVLKLMPLYKSIVVIPGLFSLTHVRNPGGAFSFMAQNGSPWRHWLFLVAGIIALALIVYFYSQTPKTHPFLAVALSLVFGGAVGNLADRVRLGEVVDFLDFYVAQWHWPTFNVADSAVTVGIGIFIAHIVFKKMPF